MPRIVTRPVIANMASVTRLRRPSVVRSRHWRKQAKQTIISGMGGCSWCRVGLGNPYSTRCVTTRPYLRIVLSRPASSPYFGEGIAPGKDITHTSVEESSDDCKPKNLYQLFVYTYNHSVVCNILTPLVSSAYRSA